MYYICVTYTWGSSFFFFWLMKLYTEILCANESDTTYIYSIQYKWEVEVSFEPKAIDIITRTLLTFFFKNFLLRGLLWLSGIVWFCLHELKSSSPLLVSGKKIKKSLTLFIGIEKGDFLKLFCIKEMKIKFPKNILHKRK